MIHRLLQTPWGKWVLFIFGWALLSLLFAPEVYLYFLFRGQPVPWSQTLSMTVANLAVALVFLPFIAWLTRRYPVERQTWPKALAIHVPACLAFAMSHSALFWLLCYASRELSESLFVRFHPNLLTYWAIVGFTQAVDYFQRYTEREKQLARAELLLLKSQLHPHFLFNTLHTVSAMMHEDVQAADHTVNRLSELLRMLLDNVGVHEVPLRQEIEFLKKFVEIEQIRFPDRLELRLDVDEETLDARVPSMLLQPLVENSIRHGIDLRQGKGFVDVTARRQGDRVVLIVVDNGSGISDDRAGHEGLGLKNASLRLQQLYGENYSFRAGNREEGRGFQVRLEIPFHLDTEAELPAYLESDARENSRSNRGRRALGTQAHPFSTEG